MTRPLLLSLFRGIGLLDYAFEEEWPEATIVCGPDVIWGGDIRRFHAPPGVFDGVFGGPPCKPFSLLANIARAKGVPPRHPNLIPEFERVVAEAQPRWFLMENVRTAPEPRVPGYQVHSVLLSPHWLGEEQSRVRRFSFGTRDGRALDVGRYLAPVGVPHDPEYAVTCRRGYLGMDGRRPRRPERVEKIIRARRRTIARCCELQGMPPDFLAESPFTAAAKRELIGNGVPLQVGRVIVRAIREALGDAEDEAARAAGHAWLRQPGLEPTRRC